jgi:hypothetical protein
MTIPSPWSPESAAAVLAAGEVLAEAVRAHARAVASVSDEAQAQSVFEAGETLLPAALAYADAQFDHSGAGWPLGVLYQLVDDDDES